MREALQALYLKNDSSSFQQLLGFTNVVADIFKIEDGVRPHADEVLHDIKVHEENRQLDNKDNLLDKKWNNDNIDRAKVTKIDKSIDFSENRNVTKKENCADFLECDKCGKKFRLYGAAFRRHKVVKHKEKEEEVDKEWETLQHKFLCPCKICGKKFFNKRNMRDHKRREHPVNRNIDEQERVRIRREKDKIRKKRRVVCEHCSKSVSVNNLKMHFKAHERKDNASQQDFNCTVCRMGSRIGKYKTEDALQRHVLKCHSGLVYQCELCDNASTSPHAKTLHFNSQHGEKTLQCNSCDKRFTANSYLRAHIKKRHEKVKDKKCPHCGEEFQAGIAFQAHVLRHTDNRQFACEICGKSFLVQSHLKSHARTHTLPFSCNICNLKFSSGGILKKHTRIEHENQQIDCRHGCGFSCWESSNRNRHEKSCKQNPLPNAPYSVSAGTASSLTLQVNFFLYNSCTKYSSMT